MNPQTPLVRSRLGVKAATQVPPPEEILQTDIKGVRHQSFLEAAEVQEAIQRKLQQLHTEDTVIRYGPR